MKVKVIIQSRLSSKRLPAKALLMISGYPSVVLCAKRAANTGLDVVVATSTEQEDILIVKALEKYGVGSFCGSLDDVLVRFIQASEDLEDTDVLVRLTADNLFPDGKFLDEIITHFVDQKYEYLTTTFPESPMPYGLSAEIFTVGLLRRVHQIATTKSDREHVTSLMQTLAKNSSRYVPNLTSTMSLNLSHCRCTLDNYDDYLNISDIFNHVENPIDVSWDKLVEYLAIKERDFLPSLPSKIIEQERHCEMTLGTAQLGFDYGRMNVQGMPSDKQAHEILHHAIKLGITHVDTARAYGIAEERISAIFQGNKNAHIHVVTKLDPLKELKETSDLDTVNALVKASVYQSLFTLKLDVLPTLMLHRFEHLHCFDGAILKQLKQFKEEGLIKKIGVSVYSPSDAISALECHDIQHLQIPFNVLDHRWLQADFQQALKKRQDVCVHVRSALLQGILGAEAHFWPEIENCQHENTVARLDSFVNKFKRINKIDLCYAFVRAFPWVTSVVVGVDTLAQLHENYQYFQHPCLEMGQVKEMVDAFADIPERLLNPANW